MLAKVNLQAKCLVAARVSRRPIAVSARGAIGGGMPMFKDAPKDLLSPKQLPTGKGHKPGMCGNCNMPERCRIT